MIKSTKGNGLVTIFNVNIEIKKKKKNTRITKKKYINCKKLLEENNIILNLEILVFKIFDACQKRTYSFWIWMAAQR